MLRLTRAHTKLSKQAEENATDECRIEKNKEHENAEDKRERIEKNHGYQRDSVKEME